MCIKNSPPPDHDHDHVEELQSNRSLMMKEEAPLKRLAARKSRSKTRKPKFLSLRSQLISQLDDHQDYARPKSSSTSTITTMSTTDNHCHHQLNLFPLHPENLVDHQDRAPEMHDDNNVALLFHSDGGATLHGLLTSTTSTATDTTTTTTTTLSSDQEESLSSFPYYRSRSSQDQYYYSEEGDYNIVRTAMRRRERDMGSSVDEKWVCYSELVEVPEEFTSSTSTASACGHHVEYHHHQDQRCRKQHKVLALKLDYQEILNAWSDKGPLYIEGLGESPQRVPDLQDIDHHLFQLHDTTTSNIENVIDSGNLWRVPEEGGSFIKMKSEVEVGGRSREASVLRYKEKRQSRLFSKRIRYQVRKLNAEKRPRMKGRFVKRN